MKSLFNQIFHTLKVFILFVGFTILFYIGMMWINQEYENYNRYDEPNGTSVKVSSNQEQSDSTWFDRLKLFYLNGE
ncbi:YqzK family protein [Bacillus massiliigorillae]|uniref:YqzK family protein n=1 Tax=Bacillus massiliigorillae TaxID=1243664 RepID=UPI0003A96D12|nr:YqzK family protein [Bacillus massiliigorillae]